MRWKIVPIGEVAKVVSGSTPRRNINEYWDGDIQWATPKDLSALKGKYISATNDQITESGVHNSSAKILPPRSIILSSRAPIGYVAINTVPMATNQGCKNIIIDEKLLFPEFLYYWLSNQTKYLNSLGRGATFKEISKSIVEKIEIPLPPLEEQRRIAAILDQADQLRQQRQRAIDRLDDLLQSVFLDMFGDPVTNPMGWEVKELGDVVSHVSSGSTPKGGSSVYQDHGFMFIRSQNVLNLGFDFSDVAYISSEIHNSMKRTWVKNGDVLLNITGASIGRVNYYQGEDDISNVNQHVCIIRPNTSKIKPEFLTHLIGFATYQRKILGENKGATRQAFNFKQIRGFKIILPPLEVQEEFRVAISKIKMQKRIMLNSQSNFSNMFSSLQQHAFRGEL